MKRFFTIKGYIPFTYKMMIPYLILVLITDAAIGLISYSMLVKSRTEVAEAGVRATLQQTRNNVDYRMEEVMRMSDLLFGSLTFQRALLTKGDRLALYYTMMDNIVPQLQAPLRLIGSPTRLTLYTSNEAIGEVLGEPMDKPITRSSYFILPLNRLEKSEWFKTLQAENKDNLWMQIEGDARLGNLSHFRKMVSYADYQTVIGYIQITINLESLLGNLILNEDEQMGLQVLDTNTGNVLYKRGADLAGNAKGQNLSLREPIPGTSYVIEVLVSRDYLSKDANQLQTVIILICAASFLLMAMIGLLVASFSGKKMKRIVTHVRSFRQGDLEQRIDFTGNDEFVLIAQSFNSMAASIQELIGNVYEQGLQKKQAELEALQAQINPHFLYNALSTISSLSNLGEPQKVTEMVKGLARFYRLTLNEGQVLIPMEKELEQVQAYLAIQKVKHADAFNVYVEMEPEIGELKIIKLLLQPFVENVFKHAWFGETIAIRITAKRVDGRLELKVIDNGVGMRKETVNEVLRSSIQSNHYGLKNVEDRIKLRYGQEYGVQIGSVYGGGTTVQILLPLQPEQNFNNDESSYSNRK
ncbi:sensor histidine kinase [Paenibacillus pasadenensis]|uniref:sensor histidine kinase n=1 Tax=Paenibacillus pasadenensis TaxID=217090 RepID=UPI00203EFBB3|nr:sensor histidine kinase [Paenibacillus pasadenensis]MCM3746325.1 sensor histidine kinase [Paenibacillus pasadenensis]